MTHHRVKSWPEFFAPVFDGRKSFDLRINDRHYQFGDLITLREYDDRKGVFTGREITKRITYIAEGVGYGAITPLLGLSRDYVILSLADIEREENVA